MKEYYAKAGLPTARYHLVEGLEDALEFANYVGYPVVVKPDNGVGANNTYKLKCDDDVRWFIDTKDDNVYIMEEFVNGFVQTYDAIVDSQGNPLFESGNITPQSLMDIVNEGGDSMYYLVKGLPDAIRDAGLRVPQDISLVGFDDSEISNNSIPRLTTMTHPKDHLGRAAAEAILRQIRNPEGKVENVTYRPGLVIRQSVRDLNVDPME